jgi:uncharacterized protein (TIGR03435 family)
VRNPSIFAPAICALQLACVASAQQPAFEVATVKPSDTGSTGVGGSDGFRGGRFGIRNATLKHLIQIAYGVEHYRVSGGPAWLDSERYSVEAKPGSPVNDETARLMLQALLAERFGLKLHRTTTTVPGYTLLAEKGDEKLSKSTAEGVGFRFMTSEKIEGPGTMDMLARVLKGILGSPVEDQTGLKEKYDINLTYKNSTEAEFGLSIFTAVKLQLGLTLKAGKIPIEILVVDQANKQPTAN